MRDSHEMVVHYICEIIGRITVRLNEDHVIQLLIGRGNITVDLIVKCRCALGGHVRADDIRLSGCQICLNLLL